MKTVFVVDDSDTNRMAAKTALDGTYKTYAIPSGAKMFKLAERIMPDIILLDIEMPEMDGFEAIGALKENEKLKDVPVLFLTAKNDKQSETHALEAGALDLVNKPFSAPELIKKIEMYT